MIEVRDGRVVVEHFISPNRQDRVAYDPSDLVGAPLARQTRCYLFEEEAQRWYMGRIGQRDGVAYEVLLPDRTSLWLPEPHIYVRCAAAPEDPTDTLSVYGQETAHFHSLRAPFIRQLVRQRAAARGMTGLTSSRVELFPHQVEIARRVLQDPLQRYLLSDEVGLGKTIEAGIILRQYLLDEPDGHALVLVPPLLLEQWSEELDSKFDVLRDGRVTIASVLDVERIEDRREYGLLVVDEAHHLASGATAADPAARGRFAACRRLAHRIPRLLLLSATPAANHEAQFLAMLHLLDPETYALDDVAAFRDRVAKRQEIGSVLLTLTETARPYALRATLDQLEALFPGDALLADCARQLRDVLADGSADAARRTQCVRALRAHVSDTYRLHRRMLRNRRSALEDAVRARSSHRVLVEHDVTDTAGAVADALEEWRSLAAGAVRDDPPGATSREGLLRVFLVLAQCADGSPWLLEDAVQYRLASADRLETGDGAAARLTAEFSAEFVHALRAAPPFTGERELLRNIAAAASAQTAEAARVHATAARLAASRARAGTAAPPKWLVCSGFTATARRVAEALRRALGKSAVACHVAGMERSDAEQEVQRFRGTRDCYVLVCDSSAEEGRNLQFAEHLVHYDLPWQPNRLEQRIGRADRISRRRDLTTHLLLGPDRPDALGVGWYRLLADGFALFSSSIASLQFFVETALADIHAAAFREGAQGLVALIDATRAGVAQEQEKVEEQAAIDEIDAREESAAAFFERLDASDAAFEQLQDAAEGWLCRGLNFARTVSGPSSKTVAYSASLGTLVPEDVLNVRFRPWLDRPGTYDRTAAARSPRTALFRPGDEFLDALADYAAWDDRGQTFAIWREDHTWSGEEGAEWAGFRFDVVIEASDDGAAAVLADAGVRGADGHALQRRADALLPPRVETIFLDAGLQEVTDPAILERLNRPFSKFRTLKGRDHNLTKHRVRAIEGVVAADVWGRLCRDARDASLARLRARPRLVQLLEVHASAGRRALDIKLEQLRLRALREGSAETGAARRELRLETALADALIRGVSAPRIRIDSVGFIVISGRAPGVPLPPHPRAMQHA